MGLELIEACRWGVPYHPSDWLGMRSGTPESGAFKKWIFETIEIEE
jgi:hypothetical protein